jgi:uncharacterized protein (TIGR00251 family)
LINAAIVDRRYSLSMATLRVHLVPNAKIDKVVGEHGGAIKIKLRAPAVEGKANAALISFLAERLKVPARTIVLMRGQKSRDKVIRIDGLSEKDVRRRLL